MQANKLWAAGLARLKNAVIRSGSHATRQGAYMVLGWADSVCVYCKVVVASEVRCLQDT